MTSNLLKLTGIRGQDIGVSPAAIVHTERQMFNKTTKITLYNGDTLHVKETFDQIKRKQSSTTPQKKTRAVQR